MRVNFHGAASIIFISISCFLHKFRNDTLLVIAKKAFSCERSVAERDEAIQPAQRPCNESPWIATALLASQ